MCNPLLLAGAALTVGSTASNYLGDQARRRAENNVFRDEQRRQENFQRENEDINRRSQDEAAGFQEKQAQKQQELKDYFQNQNAANDPNIMPSSASSVVEQEEARQRAKAHQYTQGQAERLANLRSFGDVLGGFNRGLAQSGGQLGLINSLAEGSRNVLPFELNDASQRGGGWRMLGDVLGGLGSVGVSAGLGAGGMNGLYGGLFGRKIPNADPNLARFISGTGLY